MQRLFLMCGLSFAGKSTLAAAMARHLACPVISLDALNAERGLGFGGDGIPVEEWEKTHRLATERMNALMIACGDVILDDTNCFRWLRDRYRELAATNGYGTVVVYCLLPLEQLRERMRLNAQTKERGAIKDEIFDELLRGFEPPSEDEPRLTFDGSVEPDEWVKTNLHGP